MRKSARAVLTKPAFIFSISLVNELHVSVHIIFISSIYIYIFQKLYIFVLVTYAVELVDSASDREAHLLDEVR